MKTSLAVSTTLCVVAVVLQFGVLAGSAQTGQYLYSGSETTITLNPGTYDITAFGAAGGDGPWSGGGIGAEMEAEFNFTTVVTLTLLVGGSGNVGGYYLNNPYYESQYEGGGG